MKVNLNPLDSRDLLLIPEIAARLHQLTVPPGKLIEALHDMDVTGTDRYFVLMEMDEFSARQFIALAESFRHLRNRAH